MSIPTTDGNTFCATATPVSEIFEREIWFGFVYVIVVCVLFVLTNFEKLFVFNNMRMIINVPIIPLKNDIRIFLRIPFLRFIFYNHFYSFHI